MDAIAPGSEKGLPRKSVIESYEKSFLVTDEVPSGLLISSIKR
jgi:hypothetical protein